MSKTSLKPVKIWAFPVFFLWMITMQTFQDKPNKALKGQIIGNLNGENRRVIQNKKGEFVIVGTAKHGWFGRNTDVFFTVIDSMGNTLVREKRMGGGDTEGSHGLIQTTDGNYVIAGFKNDAPWLVKVDETGRIIQNFRVETIGQGAFTDVLEGENGALWVTGEIGKQLCVVHLDAAGNIVNTSHYRNENGSITRGSGMAWAVEYEEKHLVIVGTETAKKQKNLLLLTFDTEGSFFEIEKSKTIENAEGQAITRDENDNFGIIGTQHTETGSDILFAFYDALEDEKRLNPISFGKKFYDDKGLGIAADGGSNFVLAGQFFEKEGDRKTQAWLHKIDASGRSMEQEPLALGGNGEDRFQSVTIATNGDIIAVGNWGNKPYFTRLKDPSVYPQIPSEIVPILNKNDSFLVKNAVKDTNFDAMKIDWDVAYKIKNGVKQLEIVRGTALKIVITTRQKMEDLAVRLVIHDVEKDNSKGDNESIALSSNEPYTYRCEQILSFNADSATAQIEVENRHTGQRKLSDSLKVFIKFPRLFILAIGIPYDSITDAKKLYYTKRDAAEIIKIFKTQKPLYKQKGFIYKSLTTKEATTAANLKKQISTFFERSEPTDIALLFISGHGSSRNGKVIVWGSDYKQYDETTHVDYLKDIKTPFDAVKAKRFVFIDACRSNGTNQDVAYQGKGENERTDAEELNLMMLAPSAYRLIQSCRDKEKSYEHDALQHGFFTYALLEAFRKTPLVGCLDEKGKPIKCQASGANDGTLTFEKLGDYTRKRVPFLIDSLKNKGESYETVYQNPIHTSTSKEDMSIFIFPKMIF